MPRSGNLPNYPPPDIILADIADLAGRFGKTPQKQREQLYDQFRNGELRALILSCVGNFALDLPDADVLDSSVRNLWVATGRSQRLGRILRPKADGRHAQFFTLVSHHTREEEYARNRQLFLTEQGYSYQLQFTNGG